MSVKPHRRRSDTASRAIGPSPDTIYQAFSHPASLMQWLPPSGMSGRALEYDFREGGRYRIELRYKKGAASGSGKTADRTDITNGRFLQLVPGRHLKQSVEFESSDPAFAGEMTVTWSFEPAPEGTIVTVTAENVPSGISKADHDAGLRSSLNNVAEFVEPRKCIEARDRGSSVSLHETGAFAPDAALIRSIHPDLYFPVIRPLREVHRPQR